MPITKDTETKPTTTKPMDPASRDNKVELPTSIDKTDFPGGTTNDGTDSGVPH